MGDANASIPTPQPVLARPMFGASPPVAAASSLTFVSPAAHEDGIAERLELGADGGRLTEPVQARGKSSMPENDALPRIDVDPERFTVRVDGEEIVPGPGGRAATGPALLSLLMADRQAPHW